MNALEQYMDQEQIHSFEGPSGVRKFTKIVNALGYCSLNDFLEDNSGAMDAMAGFVNAWVGRNTEWRIALESQLHNK